MQRKFRDFQKSECSNFFGRSHKKLKTLRKFELSSKPECCQSYQPEVLVMTIPVEHLGSRNFPFFRVPSQLSQIFTKTQRGSPTLASLHSYFLLCPAAFFTVVMNAFFRQKLRLTRSKHLIKMAIFILFHFRTLRSACREKYPLKARYEKRLILAVVSYKRQNFS